MITTFDIIGESYSVCEDTEEKQNFLNELQKFIDSLKEDLKEELKEESEENKCQGCGYEDCVCSDKIEER